MWSELLQVANENQGFDSYREFLIAELKQRTRKVSVRRDIWQKRKYIQTSVTHSNISDKVMYKFGENSLRSNYGCRIVALRS